MHFSQPEKIYNSFADMFALSNHFRRESVKPLTNEKCSINGNIKKHDLIMIYWIVLDTLIEVNNFCLA
ncbi:hypothetical protein T08_1928 [Trichinella sp. T8]|nr:hypothetical protein T08_1928 [Trichinella sp. T8]